MQRTLATRLEKVERRNKPADAVFFLVWGADRAGVDKAVAEARVAGKIGGDDIVIAEVWPTELEPRPETRWLLNGLGAKGCPMKRNGFYWRSCLPRCVRGRLKQDYRDGYLPHSAASELRQIGTQRNYSP
jgi:hypothetical protein